MSVAVTWARRGQRSQAEDSQSKGPKVGKCQCVWPQRGQEDWSRGARERVGRVKGRQVRGGPELARSLESTGLTLAFSPKWDKRPLEGFEQMTDICNLCFNTGCCVGHKGGK